MKRKNNKNSKLGIIGAFDYKNMSMGGQPVKTRQLASTLRKEYGEKEVYCIDTHDWKKTFLSMALGLIKMIMTCDTIIMLPASNGVHYFSRILVFLKRFFRKAIFYDVIGGWLAEITKKDEKVKHYLKEFNGIWVETNHMKTSLEKQGFSNVDILQNYKNLDKLSFEDLKADYSEPYDICTFSRVMEEKGIEDAIQAVTIINDRRGRCVYRLHIFGPIDENYKTRFNDLCKSFPDFITYEGLVPQNRSVEVLQNFFYLLFPTHFFTEGIPGTIIDAYSAGIPVLSSKWESYADVLKEGKTGFCYSFGEMNELIGIMESVIDAPQKIINLKKNCLEEASFYSEPEFVKRVEQLLNG